MRDTPQLLVEWEPGWRSFASSIRAVLRKQPRDARFIGVPYGIRPRGPASSLLFHFALVFAYLSLSPWFHLLRPVQPVAVSEYQAHVYNGPIYYLSQGLPPVADRAGAENGRAGRAGGSEAFHPKQVIRIARGNRVSVVIVDAPALNLPRTDRAVANLLALFSPIPAPPAQSLRNVQRIVAPQIVAVAPSPDAAHLAAARMPEVRPEVIAPPVRANEVSRNAKLLLPPVEAVPPIPGAPVGSASAIAARIDAGVPIVLQPAPNPEQLRSATGLSNLPMVVGGVASGADNGAGSGPPAALIITVDPGETIGNPAGEPGSLAKSPTGTGAGLGGSGRGSGTGKGPGPGSGDKGTGPGSGSAGTGLGSNPNAHGNSPAAGPGGAGTGTPGVPIMAGVSISGTVHLPSFGGPSSGPTVPNAPDKNRGRPPAVIVIASPRSVTTLGNLGALHGGRVYTIYLDTRAGTAVMQFSDPSAREKFEQDLTAPEPLLVEVPAELKITQTLASCVLDRSGALRNIHILRSATPEFVAKLVSVLEKWRFRPVFRGSEPIDVETLLGFGIDTR